MKEALKLALEALERYQIKRQDFERFADVITAIKEALVQPEQEPVAWEQFYPDIGKPQLRQEPSITKEARGTLILHSGWDDLPNGTKFYTTPPKRPWVGLTDDEIQECYSAAYKVVQGRQLEVALYRAIEDKLKELNT